jgi:hypothetical protein
MNAVGRWFGKRRSKKRWALYGIGAFIALIVVLALVVPAPDETTSTPEADEPDAAEPETTTEPDETTQAPEPSNVDKLRQAFEDTDLLGEDLTLIGLSDGFLTVRFKVADNFTDGAIRGGIAIDTFAILEAALDSGAEWRMIDIEGTFPLVDEFGNEEQGRVYQAVFRRKIVEKINFEGIDEGSLDGVERLTASGSIGLHPDLRD